MIQLKNKFIRLLFATIILILLFHFVYSQKEKSILKTNNSNLSKNNDFFLPRSNKLQKFRTKIVRIKRTKTVSTARCGSPSVVPQINRIINGSKAEPFSWPWIVSISQVLEDTNKHVCAGTIISVDYILTAAHCLRERTFKKFLITAGLESLNDQKTKQNTYEIKKFIIHPEYNHSLYKNDIALIVLNRSLKFSEKILPICLPPYETESIVYKNKVFVIGWGSNTGFWDDNSNYLKQTALTILDRKNYNICNNALADYYCALDKSGINSNICFGDSGGPMMLKINEKWYLYGLSNFLTVLNSFNIFNPICDNYRPSYFVNIFKYLDWILLFLNK
ncbi:unnamed protein product [Brachionus calyciflorus]|uniref:Acrosin n=1 Tax=Brachionus calyciflorus TaxID=104777 RepID=A0A813QAV7_9BILA|nr:unnamed protein product [Brachionus calyciflorus]